MPTAIDNALACATDKLLCMSVDDLRRELGNSSSSDLSCLMQRVVQRQPTCKRAPAPKTTREEDRSAWIEAVIDQLLRVKGTELEPSMINCPGVRLAELESVFRYGKQFHGEPKAVLKAEAALSAAYVAALVGMGEGLRPASPLVGTRAATPGARNKRNKPAAPVADSPSGFCCC